MGFIIVHTGPRAKKNLFEVAKNFFLSFKKDGKFPEVRQQIGAPNAPSVRAKTKRVPRGRQILRGANNNNISNAPFPRLWPQQMPCCLFPKGAGNWISPTVPLNITESLMQKALRLKTFLLLNSGFLFLALKHYFTKCSHANVFISIHLYTHGRLWYSNILK